MKIIKIAALENGAHKNQTINGEIPVPEGWAVIPDDMELPQTFPFVDITVEEITHYREVPVMKDVPKTREVPQYDEEGNAVLDDEGNPVMVTEEYTEMEMVTEQEPYTIPTVTSMTEGVMPEPEPIEPKSVVEVANYDELAKAIQEGVNEV
jgi:hypothetical protein